MKKIRTIKTAAVNIEYARGYGYMATLEGYDGSPDAVGPEAMAGYGRTEDEAFYELEYRVLDWMEREGGA